jgi:xanthine/CO dehydrogenase XdhC/CoxF family maturation factor
MLGARFRTSGREEKGGNTLCVLVAGEEIDEDLGTWRRAAAAVAPVWGERERSTRVEGGCLRRTAVAQSAELFGPGSPPARASTVSCISFAVSFFFLFSFIFYFLLFIIP